MRAKFRVWTTVGVAEKERRKKSDAGKENDCERPSNPTKLCNAPCQWQHSWPYHSCHYVCHCSPHCSCFIIHTYIRKFNLLAFSISHHTLQEQSVKQLEIINSRNTTLETKFSKFVNLLLMKDVLANHNQIKKIVIRWLRWENKKKRGGETSSFNMMIVCILSFQQWGAVSCWTFSILHCSWSDGLNPMAGLNSSLLFTPRSSCLSKNCKNQ